MIGFCKRLSGGTLFHNLIIAVILLNSVVLGLETSQSIMRFVGSALHVLDWVIQAIFVFEITVRILAYWPKPRSFFRGGWNVFDWRTSSSLPLHFSR